jgi:2-dehydro-3-deoxy-D-gluconate 5-dehydrogenase
MTLPTKLSLLSDTALSGAELQLGLDVNLTEAILCTRAVGPHMLERRAGKVINISSHTAGKDGGEMVVYTLTKTALVGFTRAQALEWASYNVQVNAIAPGIFPDPVTAGEAGARRTAERRADGPPGAIW